MNVGGGDDGTVAVACAVSASVIHCTHEMAQKKLKKEAVSGSTRKNDIDNGSKTLEERLEDAINNLLSVLLEFEAQRNPIALKTENTEVEENPTTTSHDNEVGPNSHAKGKRKRPSVGMGMPRDAQPQPPTMMTKETIVKTKGFIDRIHTVIDKLGPYIECQVEQIQSFFDSSSQMLSLGPALISHILGYCNEADLYNCERASYTLNDIIFDYKSSIWDGKNPYEILVLKREAELKKILPNVIPGLHTYYFRLWEEFDKDFYESFLKTIQGFKQFEYEYYPFKDFPEEFEYFHRAPTHTTNHWDRMCHNIHFCKKRFWVGAGPSYGEYGKLPHRRHCTTTMIKCKYIQAARSLGAFSALAQQFENLAENEGLIQCQSNTVNGADHDQIILAPWRYTAHEASPLGYGTILSRLEDVLINSDYETFLWGVAFLRLSYCSRVADEQRQNSTLLWEGFVTARSNNEVFLPTIILRGDAMMKQTFQRIYRSLNERQEEDDDLPSILPHQLRIVVITLTNGPLLVTQGCNDNEQERNDDDDAETEQRRIPFHPLVASGWEGHFPRTFNGPPQIQCHYVLENDDNEDDDEDIDESRLIISTNHFIHFD